MRRLTHHDRVGLGAADLIKAETSHEYRGTDPRGVINCAHITGVFSHKLLIFQSKLVLLLGQVRTSDHRGGFLTTGV